MAESEEEKNEKNLQFDEEKSLLRYAELSEYWLSGLAGGG